MKIGSKCISKPINAQENDEKDEYFEVKNNIISIIMNFSDLKIIEKNIPDLEEILVQIIKCAIEFPMLIDFILENLDINKIIFVFNSYCSSTTIIHFFALFIHKIKIRNVLSPVYDNIIQNYLSMGKIQKDYIRLLFINLSSCENNNEEYEKVITFLRIIGSQETLEWKEILDSLVIVEILTTTIFLIPHNFVEIILSLFQKIFLEFIELIKNDLEARKLCLSIIANFGEEGYFLKCIETTEIIEILINNEDLENLFEYIRAKLALSEISLNIECFDDLPYKFKLLLSHYFILEDEEEEEEEED